MAHYKDLPIWRDAMRLAVEMELAVRGFPRYHKHTLGTELRQYRSLFSPQLLGAASPRRASVRPAIEVWQVPQYDRCSSQHSSIGAVLSGASQ